MVLILLTKSRAFEGFLADAIDRLLHSEPI
jgi:hypothetical protein